MIFNPAVIALTIGSFLVSGYALYASLIGFQITQWWDIGSGSERQLVLERRTYLVSTILTYVVGFELLSLFLFVYTADHMHTLFVGAMCAAGSLNVNDYGYLTLIVKTINFILCGIWLIVNYVDNRAVDYPLIKAKYRFLGFMTGLLIIETLFQINYFLEARPEVITSCCGTLFSEEAKSIAGGIAALPSSTTKIVFYLSLVLTLRTGIYFYVSGKAARLFSYLSTWFLLFSVVSIISFISVYFYELPTHHCPFCLLQKEYHYIGYPLYLSLFGAGILGASVGVIGRFREIPSLTEVILPLQKRLCLFSMFGYIIFVIIASFPMVFSDFKLEGY